MCSKAPPYVYYRVIMASDDIVQLADALAKTHVGDGELSYKGLGLKLDDAESGERAAGHQRQHGSSFHTW